MDGASQELRFFDPAGGYVRSVGGRGSGPGEFVVARFVRPYRGDSLFVHDLVGARITILDSAGSFGRMFSTGKVAGINWWWRGPVAGDRFILESSSGPSGRTRQLTWDSSLVIVAAADGESADTLGMWPYAQSSTAPTPYYAIAHVAPSPAGFFWGMSSEYLIQEYSPAGALLRSIRRAVNPISITQSMLEGYRDDGNEVNTADMQHPDHLPFYSALLVDEVGNLWIRRHGVSRLYAEHREWDVFDGVDGRWLGTVDMPAGLRVTEIGDDYVLGIAADSLGVESVVLHTLRKDGG
jgi:hypothetical protein